MPDNMLADDIPTTEEEEVVESGAVNGQAVDEEEPAGESKADDKEAKTDLIFGKYKTQEDAEKGYKELVQKLTEKGVKAPEEYVFDFSEDEDLKDLIAEDYDFADDPLVKTMSPAFKDANLSQEQVTALTKAFLQYQGEAAVNVESEIKNLGADAENILKSVKGFTQRPEFSSEERETIENWATSAKDVKVLNKITEMMSAGKRIPTEQSVNASDSSSAMFEAARKFKNSTENFSMNTSAQSQYEAMMDAAIAAEEKGR